jgi:hypothetical protein
MLLQQLQQPLFSLVDSSWFLKKGAVAGFLKNAGNRQLQLLIENRRNIT